MMTAASPATIIPSPIPTSANPWYCATSPPENATSAFASASPIRRIASASMPCARTIFSFSPVARSASPRSVWSSQ